MGRIARGIGHSQAESTAVNIGGRCSDGQYALRARVPLTIVKGSQDRLQVFNFFMGFTR